MSLDLVCFSHLRWDFVYQRPNHLMVRAARDRRVYFVEEPRATGGRPRLNIVARGGVTIVTPMLPESLSPAERPSALAALMDSLVASERIRQPLLWYYTPMALPWTSHLAAGFRVYDSMDNLLGFRGAPPDLLLLEDKLLEAADLVFCGGASLHERMQTRHAHSYCFPSSVDVPHFERARVSANEPADQAHIGRPRVGYAGVIDERLDLGLILEVAESRPGWQIILMGPIAKLEPGELPSAANIHQLGLKAYGELPAYLAGWDIGWMPFARNDATRFISPTKTPEYLAAGLAVVSTSIRDVVDPYGRHGLVAIADRVDDTIAAIEQILRGRRPEPAAVDDFLASRSWDLTWSAMNRVMAELEVDRPKQQRLVGSTLQSHHPTTGGQPSEALAEVAPTGSTGRTELASTAAAQGKGS